MTACLSNLVSDSATIRRAGTDAAIAVCIGSRRPQHFLQVSLVSLIYLPSPPLFRSQVLFNSLFALLPSSTGEASPLANMSAWGLGKASNTKVPALTPSTENEEAILGALMAFRKVMSSFFEVSKVTEENVQVSRGEHLSKHEISRRQPPSPPFPQLLDVLTIDKLFRYLLTCLEHSNHNVVTSGLETLQQLLNMLKRRLLHWFRAPHRYSPCIRRLASLAMDSEKRIRWARAECCRRLWR